MNIPFYVAVLDLRTVYDEMRSFLQELLVEHLVAASFCWNGRCDFEVHLSMDSDNVRNQVLGGVWFRERRVSGSIELDVLRKRLGGDAERLIHSLDEIRMLDSALAELRLPADASGQAMGNRGLEFSMATFCNSYPLKPLSDNWDVRQEMFASAMSHYQARMAMGRRPLDAVDENVTVHQYYDGSPSPWGEEQ